VCSQVLVQPADQGMYMVHTPHFVVPCLVPLLQYTFQVRCGSMSLSALHACPTPVMPQEHQLLVLQNSQRLGPEGTRFPR
jgi:hypothetical protein